MKIFFSHSSIKKTRVREFAAALRLKKPLEPWIDEEGLAAGQSLREVLDKAINRDVSYFAVFLDKESLGSEWVRQEIEWAKDNEKRLGRPFLVPIIMDAEARRATPDLLGDDRVSQEWFGNAEDEMHLAVERLASSIFMLTAAHVERLERAEPAEGGDAARSLPVRTLGTRSALSPDHWREIFASAKQRIWLLGHSMRPSVAQDFSGLVLRDRLAAGVDVRIVTLDPDDPANQQIREITAEMHDLDLRSKILETLDLARDLPKARVIPIPPNLSIGTTRSTVNNSIVIVDARVIVTLYSHNKEMGDTGVTLDLNRATEPERCAFFETEFLWHWSHAQSALDPTHNSPEPSRRIINYATVAKESIAWAEGTTTALPPPRLAVIFPTYRCNYGARSRLVSDTGTMPPGPHAERLLCSNCMYGAMLNHVTPDMSPGAFENTCESLLRYGVECIEIAGGGEPLHHPAAREIVASIARTRSRHENARFGLIANIAALPSVCPASAFVEAFHYVRWSWPEDAELDTELRAKYLEGISNFVAQCRTSNTAVRDLPRIGVKVLLTPRNVVQDGGVVLALVRDIIQAGVDHVKIRTLRCSAGDATPIQTKTVADATARLELALRDEGLLGRGKTIELDVADRTVPSNYRCKLSTLFTVIDPHGSVRMCWNDVDDDPARVIGNLSDAPIEQIWGSSRHREIVLAMSPRSVCNPLHGCHCRVVGYQEIVDRLIPPLERRGESGAAAPRDRFI